MMDNRESLEHTLPGTEERKAALASLAARNLPLDSLADRIQDVEDREYVRAVQLRTGRNGRVSEKRPKDEKVSATNLLPKNFATRLKILRCRAGMTQRELACRLDLTREQISHMEAGRHGPSLASARKLAYALGVSLDILAGEPELN